MQPEKVMDSLGHSDKSQQPKAEEPEPIYIPVQRPWNWPDYAANVYKGVDLLHAAPNANPAASPLDRWLSEPATDSPYHIMLEIRALPVIDTQSTTEPQEPCSTSPSDSGAVHGGS